MSPNFTWVFIDWVSAGFFPGVFSPWPKKKRHRKKSLQKIFLQTPKTSVHILFQRKIQFLQPRYTLQKNQMISINSYLREIFLGCFFWEAIFRIWSLIFFSFMMISFSEILSKTFGKYTIYFTSLTLSTMLYFNPARVGEGGSLNETDICFKATFLFGRKLYNFS